MPEHIFKSPVAPGDPLWWASATGEAGSGPALVQACRSGKSVESVMFDGERVYAVTDGGNPDELGTRYACVDEASCLAWIRANMPASVLMDGRVIKAVHVTSAGETELIDLECTVNAVENLFGSSNLATDAPDATGTFAIYRKDAGPENSFATTFLRDARGNPVRALHGELILLSAAPAAQAEYAGLLLPSGPSEQVLSAVPADGTGQDAGPAPYDPSMWSSAEGLSVAGLKEFLGKIPDDAVVCCCGTDQVFFHWCPGTKSLNIDCEALADLPEYEGHEPAALPGGEA